MTQPDRIVVDFPGAFVRDPGTVAVKGSTVKAVRYSQLYKGMGRVVLDLTSDHPYKIREEKDRLVITLTQPVIKNITYYSHGDRHCLLLKGIMLTDGYEEEQKRYYTETSEEDGLKYTISFPAGETVVGNGKTIVDDALLEYYEVMTGADDDGSGENTVRIVFKSKIRLAYSIVARPETNDSAITLLDPGESGKAGPVVIDAGHGGVDPGALGGGLKEKDINLDIAARLNQLLIKNNVKTYMTRDDDCFVGVYERTYIANKLNACLFLSIHNNAIPDPAYRGTMTLCYPIANPVPGKFHGKAFAGIIHKYLIGRLGTIDRKVRDKPNLVVLRETSMPAAIAEIAFITNSSDRTLLKTAKFKQQAAQALCDAVLDALKTAGLR